MPTIFGQYNTQYGIVSLLSASTYHSAMPPEDNSLHINCPDCLKDIHIGTGGQKNLQQHQNGEECCKEQQCVKQRKKLAAQQTLLSGFIIAKPHPDLGPSPGPSHTSPTYTLQAPWPLQPAPPLTSMTPISEKTTYLMARKPSKIVINSPRHPSHLWCLHQNPSTYLKKRGPKLI